MAALQQDLMRNNTRIGRQQIWQSNAGTTRMAAALCCSRSTCDRCQCSESLMLPPPKILIHAAYSVSKSHKNPALQTGGLRTSPAYRRTLLTEQGKTQRPRPHLACKPCTLQRVTQCPAGQLQADQLAQKVLILVKEDFHVAPKKRRDDFATIKSSSLASACRSTSGGRCVSPARQCIVEQYRPHGTGLAWQGCRCRSQDYWPVLTSLAFSMPCCDLHGWREERG